MKSCLVVDDSKVIRKVARHILETLDFSVNEAGDGQEALIACKASASPAPYISSRPAGPSSRAVDRRI